MTTDLQRDLYRLIRDLCAYPTGVVSDANEALFRRIGEELSGRVYRYASGAEYNGWVIPDNWRVKTATVRRNGRVVFDGKENPIGVAIYSRSFRGELDFDELKKHVVTNANLPDAHMYHCAWQYRPWDASWALCIPFRQFAELGPGTYEVDLQTEYSPGEMLVFEYTLKGRSDDTIVFNAHTCHPHMANDGVGGVALLIRLIQWLSTRDPHYSYRAIFAPEHLGTVFYLHDRTPDELERLVCGIFCEMPGTDGGIRIASTFRGNQPIDLAFRNAARHFSERHHLVPWRKGAGNDETVWEAPGYEVPFVEVTRCIDQFAPFREYHTSLDRVELLNMSNVEELYLVLQRVVEALEDNARIYRRFNGIMCLSNPKYQLYMERDDPAVKKVLAADSEKWGTLQDSLPRYFDGSLTALEIADKHDVPFHELHRYLRKFVEQNLARLEFAPIPRAQISRAGDCP